MSLLMARGFLDGMSDTEKSSFIGDWKTGRTYAAIAAKYEITGDFYVHIRDMAHLLNLPARKCTPGRHPYTEPSSLDPDRPPVKKIRNCLMHGGRFLSDGPHNHICADCKQKGVYRSGGDYDTPLGDGLTA